MKYIWIIMLIIVEIVWFIFSLKDFINTSKQFKIKYIFETLEVYSSTFIVFHLIILFLYSLYLFL